jgi:hypothetical protein
VPAGEEVYGLLKGIGGKLALVFWRGVEFLCGVQTGPPQCIWPNKWPLRPQQSHFYTEGGRLMRCPHGFSVSQGTRVPLLQTVRLVLICLNL